MQASANIAAALNPFAAAQGSGQAGMAVGVDGLLAGLFGEESEEATGKDGGFADVLGAAMAALQGAPLPTQPVKIASAPTGETSADDGAALASQSLSSAIVQTDLGVVALSAADVDTAMPKAVATPSVMAETESFAATTPAAVFDTEMPSSESGAAKAQPTADALFKPALQPAPAQQILAQALTATAAAAVAAAPAMDAANTFPATAPLEASASSPAPAAQSATATAAAATPPVAVQVQTASKPQAAQTAVEPGAKSVKGKAQTTQDEARSLESSITTASAEKTDTDLPEAITAVTAALTGQSEGASADAPTIDIDPAAPPIPSHAISEHHTISPALDEAPRATSQTVAHLAAQIVSKADGKSTRFDVQLDPHGLGKVDVRVEIDARGEITAALTFENPQSAAELRAKSGELQNALEQAGFDMSKTSLSFNAGGQGQQGLWHQQQQQQQHDAPVWRGRAFTDLSDTPEAAPAPVQRRAAAGGVDVRI